MEQILTYFIPILVGMDIFFLSIAGGVTLRPYEWPMTAKISTILAAVALLSAILGLVFANIFRPMVSDFSEWIGFFLIAFVGVKFMGDARSIKNEQRTYVLDDNKILWSVAAAASFSYLLIFFGLGLLGQLSNHSVITVFVSILVLSQVGLFLGSHYRPVKLGRFTKFAGGLLISVLVITCYFLK
jgi:putative Mn2+ efflux pump MntP